MKLSVIKKPRSPPHISQPNLSRNSGVNVVIILLGPKKPRAAFRVRTRACYVCNEVINIRGMYETVIKHKIGVVDGYERRSSPFRQRFSCVRLYFNNDDGFLTSPKQIRTSRPALSANA